MPPDGGLLCGLGVADLRADPWLFYMPITSRKQKLRESDIFHQNDPIFTRKTPTTLLQPESPLI